MIATVPAIWFLDSSWPDIAITAAPLILFLSSAGRVLSGAWRNARGPHVSCAGSASLQLLPRKLS